MTNKQYNIWGIAAATGYKAKIAGNIDDNTFSSLQKSIGDSENTVISQSFYKANPTSNNFFSIERVRDKVVYTIYRTNWRDPSARLSYDAISVIISSSEKIVSPLSSLNALMRTYLSQVSNKQSPNLENTLDSIPTERNSVKRSVSRKPHEGYFKYTSDTELSSVFHDSNDSLKNFTKVYFFSNLPYLENTIQNVKDYSQIRIVVINFNSDHHEITVDGRMVHNLDTTDRQKIDCYPGDEIIRSVKSKKGKIKQTPEIASEGVPIEFKKIPPRKIETDSEKRNKRNQSDKFWKTLTFIALGVLLLMIGGIFYYDQQPSKQGIPRQENVKDDVVAQFKDSAFTDAKGNTIKDAAVLFKCFQKGNFKIVLDDSVTIKTYTLLGDTAIMAKKNNDTIAPPLNFRQLPWLRNDIKACKDKDVIIEVIEAIDKVSNYEEIKSEEGLPGENNSWKLINLELHKKKKTETKFKPYNMEVLDLELEKFLKDKLPKSIFEKIKEKYKPEVIGGGEGSLSKEVTLDMIEDRYTGKGTMTYANGAKYTGEWKDGSPNGQGTKTYANGSKYVGEWKDDMMHGQGTYTYANGTVEKGLWKNDEFLSAPTAKTYLTTKTFPISNKEVVAEEVVEEKKAEENTENCTNSGRTPVYWDKWTRELDGLENSDETEYDNKLKELKNKIENYKNCKCVECNTIFNKTIVQELYNRK